MLKGFCFSLFLGAISPVFVHASDASDHAEQLSEKLTYLRRVPEIHWIEFEENNVYIGWQKIPTDFNAINRTAALNGNHSIGFGVHVWSVKSEQKGWRPGRGPYLCETTARKGKITDSSCK